VASVRLCQALSAKSRFADVAAVKAMGWMAQALQELPQMLGFQSWPVTDLGKKHLQCDASTVSLLHHFVCIHHVYGALVRPT
jgi:hypothetical protein